MVEAVKEEVLTPREEYKAACEDRYEKAENFFDKGREVAARIREVLSSIRANRKGTPEENAPIKDEEAISDKRLSELVDEQEQSMASFNRAYYNQFKKRGKVSFEVQEETVNEVIGSRVEVITDEMRDLRARQITLYLHEGDSDEETRAAMNYINAEIMLRSEKLSSVYGIGNAAYELKAAAAEKQILRDLLYKYFNNEKPAQKARIKSVIYNQLRLPESSNLLGIELDPSLDTIERKVMEALKNNRQDKTMSDIHNNPNLLKSKLDKDFK